MSMTKATLACATAASLVLAGCSAPVPGQTTANQDRGALIGAGVGALAGVLTGDTRSDRIRQGVGGALIGGAAGAAIGNNLDRQEAELRAQLDPNVEIVNNGTSLVVTLPQDVLFATGSATLSGGLQNSLRSLAVSLNNYPNTRINIIGHTDNVGEASFNFDLSQRRANAVSSILVGSGVSPSRINSFGRGEDQPRASNLDAAGRQLNRRVEIIITPL